MGSEAFTAAEPAVEIRPGVFRPDWSAVTTAAARQALRGRKAARAGLLDRWSGRLEADEDCIWRAILRLYGEMGRPPEFGDIAVEAGTTHDLAVLVLDKLRARDLIDLDDAGGRIRLAYPFTESPTRHLVELNGHDFYALCAVDALGVADMYRADTAISSGCHDCGETVHVRTAAKGRALANVFPASSVVWYDFAYDGSAAVSCCPAIVFFCSDEHLQRWLNTQTPERNGLRLNVDEALQVGRAIFGPLLVDRPRPRSAFFEDRSTRYGLSGAARHCRQRSGMTVPWQQPQLRERAAIRTSDTGSRQQSEFRPHCR